MVPHNAKLALLLSAGLLLAGCSSDDGVVGEPEYRPLELVSNEASELMSSVSPQHITGSQAYTAKDSFGFGHMVDMEGTGTIDVDLDVYPFYAYEGSDSSGDYYLVEAAITVHSDKMWAEPKNTYEKDLGTGDQHDYQNWQTVYAFYLKQLDFDCMLLDGDGNAIGEFPAGNFPTPQTTVESTTYETGFDIGLEGSFSLILTGEGIAVEAELRPEISIDNKTEHHEEALEVMNRSDSQKPAYTFKLNSNINQQNITPLGKSVTDATFYQSWLWRVPSTKDFDTQNYKLSYKTKVTYGGFSAQEYALYPYIIYTPNDTELEQEAVVVDVKAPHRNPMGQLSIENREDGRVFVTDIKVCKTGTDTVVAASGDNVYGPGDEFSAWIDEGDYDITFSKGSSDTDMKTYEYSKGALSVTRNQEVHIYTDCYFKVK